MRYIHHTLDISLGVFSSFPLNLRTMSSSSNPTNLFPFPFSESNHKIPGKNYSHTMSIGTPEISTNITNEKVATIDLNVQGFYKLYVQPFKGIPPLTMENSFIESPKYGYKVKVSSSLSHKKPNIIFLLCV